MLRPANRQVYQLAAGWRPQGGPDAAALALRRTGRIADLHGGRRLHGLSHARGRLGEVPLAATTLAFTINNLAWVPMWGLGTAVTAIVGQQLGRNCPELAARAAWTALVIALAYMGTMAFCYVAVPDWFLNGLCGGASAAAFGPLRETTIVLLRFVAAYCLFDA